jgi:hypothetical protein
MTDPCEGKYDIVSRLRDHTNRDDNDIAEAAAYIERLRAERDEARRMWCENGTYTHPRQLAKEMRWDCYKEDAK